jgi:hypothetical protein
MRFQDGLKNIVNALVNIRRATAQNEYASELVKDTELRAIYKSALGSKIVRLKSGYALKDTLQFDTDNERELFDKFLLPHVKSAIQYMIGFGRGLVVIYEPNADLSTPASTSTKYNPKLHRLKVFSGDMVTVPQACMDLGNPDYYKPLMYTVRGHNFHPSRVIDFSYYKPVETEAPQYRYGGVSEFELCYPQIINDGIIERSIGAIMDKSSRKYIKVKGFKELLAADQADSLIAFFQNLESSASILGASIIDSEDDIAVHNQTISNLGDANMIGLQRLALGTGIPLPMLVGENVKGLNSSGDTERKAFQDTIESFQNDYVLAGVQSLASKFGLVPPTFKENQGGTPQEAVSYEEKALQNAIAMRELGLDYEKYLEEKGVSKPIEFGVDDFFSIDTDEA